MPLLLLLLTAELAPAGEADAHEQANPVYLHLRRQGIAPGGKEPLPLPAPAMPDGLDSRGQLAVLKALLGEDIELEKFLEESVIAPQLLKRPEERKGGPDAPSRTLDLYFVAHGDLEPLADQAVLERLITNERRPNRPRTLTPEELKRRGIVLAPGAGRHESYGYLQANILVRVQVRAVCHSFWSRSPESIVAACMLEERFAGDAEFPNQWRPLIKKGEEDEVQEGPPQPYGGAAFYVKITKLKEPAGALFVEAHGVFTEPRKWFDGENVLRSKLPAATMALVRNFRRELVRMRLPREER